MTDAPEQWLWEGPGVRTVFPEGTTLEEAKAASIAIMRMSI